MIRISFLRSQSFFYVQRFQLGNSHVSNFRSRTARSRNNDQFPYFLWSRISCKQHLRALREIQREHFAHIHDCAAAKGNDPFGIILLHIPSHGIDHLIGRLTLTVVFTKQYRNRNSGRLHVLLISSPVCHQNITISHLEMICKFTESITTTDLRYYSECFHALLLSIILFETH